MASARISVTPIKENVSDDFPGNIAFTRHGVEIAVVTDSNAVLWARRVWDRGVWWKWYVPSYGRRLIRAKRKAIKVLNSLAYGET